MLQPVLRCGLALVLVFAQAAGYLHALSHADHSLQEAAHFHSGHAGDEPELDHSGELCLVFHAIDSTVMPTALSAPDAERLAAADAVLFLPSLSLQRLATRSRGPPRFS